MPRGRKPAVLKTSLDLAKEKEKAEKKKSPPTYKQLREERDALQNRVEELEKWIQYGHRCMICGEMKLYTETARHFYKNIDPLCKSDATCICRDCATKMARRAIVDGIEKEPTKESVKQVLFYLNRPFLNKIWDSAINEMNNDEYINKPEDVWKVYIRHVQNNIYENLTFMDSDGLGNYQLELAQQRENQEQEDQRKKDKQYIEGMGDDVKSTYLMNKKTTIRFLGYDPFEYDPVEEQPVLYAKLVNFFDDSVREDGLKLEAVIEIVQNFKDIKTINETIAKYKREIGKDPTVIATISKLAETKKKMVDSALALAKDNGISVNHNKQSRKGAGTLSGIIKELSEMNLDEAEINTFDYETSQAMSQVEENSIRNILTQLNPDENDWQKEIARQTDLLWKLQDERDKAVEYCRLLRKENKDLKDFLQEKGLIDETLQVIDE